MSSLEQSRQTAALPVHSLECLEGMEYQGSKGGMAVMVPLDQWVLQEVSWVLAFSMYGCGYNMWDMPAISPKALHIMHTNNKLTCN